MEGVYIVHFISKPAIRELWGVFAKPTGDPRQRHVRWEVPYWCEVLDAFAYTSTELRELSVHWRKRG